MCVVVLLVLTSLAGLHGNVGQANYDAGKAVLGSTKTIAKEWGRNGVLLIMFVPLHSALSILGAYVFYFFHF